jgi:hypothetical protein
MRETIGKAAKNGLSASVDSAIASVYTDSRSCFANTVAARAAAGNGSRAKVRFVNITGAGGMNASIPSSPISSAAEFGRSNTASASIVCDCR